jgi:hypothetical protein
VVNSCSTAVATAVPPPDAISTESPSPVVLTRYTPEVSPVRSASRAACSSVEAVGVTGCPATELSWSTIWPATCDGATTVTGIRCGDGECKAPR